MTKFYKKLEILCQERNLRPQSTEVMNAIGVSSPVISNWKNKDVIPRTSVLNKIAEYFNVPVNYLIDDTIDTPPSVANDSISDNILMFALFGDDTEITESDLNDVKAFAEFVKQRRHAQKK